MSCSNEIIRPKKVVIEDGDNHYFDYLHIQDQRSLKELVVISDRAYRHTFKPYVVLSNWLDLEKGDIICPMISKCSDKTSEKVIDFLMKSKAPVGTKIKECHIDWKRFKLRSLYDHFGNSSLYHQYF